MGHLCCKDFHEDYWAVENSKAQERKREREEKERGKRQKKKKYQQHVIEWIIL